MTTIEKYFAIGIPALGFGLTVLFGTPQGWWPTMPKLLVYGTVVAGIELSVFGAGAIVAGTCMWKQTRMGEFYLSIVKWLEVVWRGALIVVVFSLITVPLGLSDADYASAGVSIDFEYPSDMDFAQGNFHLTYLIQNDTDHPLTISDLRLVTFLTNARIYSPYKPFELCSDRSAIQNAEIGERVNPTGSGPVVLSTPEFESSSYIANGFTVDGSQTQVHTIEAHRGAEIQMAIKAPPETFARWNTQVICPGMKIFGGQYGRREVVCQGAERIYFPVSETSDRQGQLLDKYTNFIHRSDQQGFGLIYTHLSRTMWISKSPSHMFCKE